MRRKIEGSLLMSGLLAGGLLVMTGCDRGVAEAEGGAGGDGTRIVASTDRPPQQQSNDPHAGVDPHAGIPGMSGMTTPGGDAARATPPADNTKVEFLGLVAPKPATWKWYPPENRMRAANFVLPADSGDNQAHLVIFQGIGGSAEMNIQRWIGQFRAPEDGQVEAETRQVRVNGVDVTLAEISGDHKRMGAQWYTPEQTMLAAVLQAPQGPVQILLTGPSETVERHREGWDAMVQGVRRADGLEGPTTEPGGEMSTEADYSDGFPDAWYYQERATNSRYQHLIPLEGKPAPELQLTDWIGEPFTLEDLKGKVVVVDFWGTWCPPCRAAIPKNVALAEKYGEDVVVLGVHDSKRGADRMPELAEQMDINYPLAVDVGQVSEKAWKVRFWPTYAVVDQQGVVRAAGLMPHYIEPVVEHLLKEGGTPGEA